VTRLHLVVLATVLTASCGSVAAPRATPPPPSPSAPAGTVLVTLGSDGQTVTAYVGNRIQIALGEQYKWQLQPPDGVVLTRTAQNSALPRGTQAIWLASATGRSAIKATGNAVCPSGQPCPLFAVVFTATVVVAP
jgi:hypothetical protein